jgi:putative MATE family efflux protein
VLRVGLPATFEQIIMQGGFLVLQIVISSMGTTAIAVYSVGMSINSICFIPVWGFGIAATTLIGQCLGAKKPELAEKSGWETQKIALAVTVVLTVIVFIFAEKLVGIYSRDAEVIRIGTIAIRIFSISQPFLSIVVVISGALRGAGDIMYVMVTSFVGIWAFRILITVLLNRFFGLGIMGVWLALCLDFMIRSIMYLFRYRRGRWKAIVI